MLINMALNTLSKATYAYQFREMIAPMPGIRGCAAGVTAGCIFSVCNQDFLLMCLKTCSCSLLPVIDTGQNLLLIGELSAATVQ